MAKAAITRRKKVDGRGGARPGSGPKPLLTDEQRGVIAVECETQWLLARLDKPGGSVNIYAPDETAIEGTELLCTGKRPYRMRNQIIDDVVAWCPGALGVAVSRRMVVTCWTELRARAKRVAKAKPARTAKAA